MVLQLQLVLGVKERASFFIQKFDIHGNLKPFYKHQQRLASKNQPSKYC